MIYWRLVVQHPRHLHRVAVSSSHVHYSFERRGRRSLLIEIVEGRRPALGFRGSWVVDSILWVVLLMLRPCRQLAAVLHDGEGLVEMGLERAQGYGRPHPRLQSSLLPLIWLTSAAGLPWGHLLENPISCRCTAEKEKAPTFLLCSGCRKSLLVHPQGLPNLSRRNIVQIVLAQCFGKMSFTVDKNEGNVNQGQILEIR